MDTENKKHLKIMAKYKPIYEELKIELGLEGDEINQIHQLVEAGSNLQGQICSEADKIKIDGLEKAKNLLTIDKGTWGEFVRIVAKKLYGKFSEKSLEKLNNSVVLKQYFSNLHQVFIDSYLSDEKMKIVNEAGQSNNKFDKIENTEFANLIEHYAKIRDYINSVLYKQYNKLAKAAYYITNGKLKRPDFKDLVDWEHYKNSDDPAYPSRSWGIYNRFARMFRLLHNYEFNQLHDLGYEFGLDISLSEPHPTTHPWQIEKE